ncbi:hypothetical protein DSM104329_03205 [Capillimicrobium parvum]|uniref:Uncharacterized protein n=1 Tax=Capillimicrobium parvum TaxID=2884022 RepID=A0A9E7C1K8_9ACTN|nr:hypothetical protein DSM104329_03205 [Capillimicrobium parvum]
MATPPRFSSPSKRQTPAEMSEKYKAAQDQLKQDAADRRAAAPPREPRASRPRARG